MSFIGDFEKRIETVFGSVPRGYTPPFSFKKLAKQAAREMEQETFEINGVDTAPPLYTILISDSDDTLMRPLYQKITFEISSFVSAAAKRKGYVMVGAPLVRFMVDPSLKSGRFAVFAENVDARTLAQLTKEEKQFLNESVSMGGAAKNSHGKHSNARSSDVSSESEAGDFWNSDKSVSSSGVPRTRLRGDDAVPAPGYAASPSLGSCTLRDLSTGETYTCQGPSAVIGRDRQKAQVVLKDPNVSRAHAKLSFDGRVWKIEDLESTNGTLVNDRQITSMRLRNGDVINTGLINLEFREGL